MTKKDYELIANVLRIGLERSEYGQNSKAIQNYTKGLILNLCHELKQDNPRFDGKKFLKACGVGYGLPNNK